MRLVLSLLFLISLSWSTAFASEGNVFFEPTAEQSAQEWKAIKVQYDAYLDAKKSGDWVKARELALFHYVKAWVYNNEAYALLKAGNLDAEKLNTIVNLYQNAIEQCNLAKEKGHHLEQVENCALKANNGLAFSKKKLAKVSQ